MKILTLDIPFNNLADLNHELRIPLTGVAGAITLLKDKSLTAQEKEEFIDIAAQSVERLITIVTKILNSPSEEIETKQPSNETQKEQKVVLVIHSSSIGTNKSLKITN